MKKMFFLCVSILMISSLFSLVLATEEETTYIYQNESGETVESNDFELDNNPVLIDNAEDYENLANSENEKQQQQEKYREAFEEQSKEIAALKEITSDEKVIITEVLSDINTEYITDSYNYYVIQYQKVNIRDASGKVSPAVVILAYDVAKSKNLKPLKAGDTIYGYVAYYTQEDPAYTMVNHGFKAEEIALVSISVRENTLGIVLLTIFTILLLLIYAGKHGAKLLIPALVLLDLLFIVLVPALELGNGVLWIASLISLASIILITVLKKGWSRQTLVALLSSLCVVVLVVALGYAFGNANGLSGKGIISEENYDLATNVYYIDSIVKTQVDTFGLYLSMIMIIASVVSASIASQLVTLSEKYAGTEGMVNSIIEEAKETIGEYPLILAGIFMVMFLPNAMALVYNHAPFENIINAETFVTMLSIGLISIISAIIIAPLTAIISYLFMGKVEVKQIGGNKE